MRKIENKVMLITYADSMGSNLSELYELLDNRFGGVVEGVHILPFFPSSGDRGFAVVNYDNVDPAFGSWEDIQRFSEKYFLMADFMLNHVSIRSAEFVDYMKNGDASPYRNMFIHWDEFWPNGEPTEEELNALYRRKMDGPYMEFMREDGKKVRLWNTFFSEQVDIDPNTQATKDYYDRNLSLLAKYVPLVRFDAFAYASKRPGTSCFFVEPEVWDVLEIGLEPLRKAGTEMLPEIHENYLIQMKMAEKGYWVYDFALPMLLLHGLMSGRTDRLINWLNICPRKQFTTLDTHDGIGVVDVVHLLEMDEINLVRERIAEKTKEAQKHIKFPGMMKVADGKQVLYQLATTYYSALDENDDAYLLARAVQFFTPGIPQVYYVGLMAGANDYESLKRAGEPRGINRHNYTIGEIENEITKPVVQKLFELARFRNSCPAFDGDMVPVEDKGDGTLTVTWKNGDCTATLQADFKTRTYSIISSEGDLISNRSR